MNISLYLQDRIVMFKLPTEVSGSFSFDWQDNDNKLINVDAINGSWVLYQTDDVKIVDSNNSYIDSVELVPNNFYILERDKIKYLIYTEKKVFKNTIMVAYDYVNPLTITNKEGSIITYRCPYLNVLNIMISKRNEALYLKKDANVIYKNNKIILEEETLIKNGDEIELCGARLLFIENNIYINNIENRISFNQGIRLYQFPELDKPTKIEIKDTPLYKKDDYYSKSPRIRRRIEEKIIKLDKPPNHNQTQELPILLTIGPMITMGATSGLTLLNLVIQLSTGRASLSSSWPQLITSIAMIASMFLWPVLIRRYNKNQKEINEYEVNLKYAKYFDEKKEELGEISKQQSIILFENLITVDDCLKNIDSKTIGFWDKRTDQYDFLVARLGLGRERLQANIAYPEEGFTIDESEMKKRADELVAFFKYIESVPVGYSFATHRLTAIMGNQYVRDNFLNNIILQLISFYSYDDLKLVVITNEERESTFDYIKYLNHNFNNSKTFRYFASSIDEIKQVCDTLNAEANMRKQTGANKPYYFVIVDDYERIKHHDLIKTISESEDNLGFSVVFLENKLSNLPSKCDNFITLGDKKSDILYNAFDSHEQGTFNNEIHYNIDMMNLSKKLANIPVELDDQMSELPESITFLEMERIGKVEQLNILNRWRSNDPTRSLRAEIGVDSSGGLMYLDLHEKYHGPHGLIAGMTGSGKSEFIITYILSMAMNYSPEEVSFILIDYKGGGLAGAFENKVTGIVLPHLAGTITNLDKAEMDRTLVSIDSELQRRQRLFNEARDNLGESTIDIYKYQGFYRDGRLSEPIPHLFIICDEFAELKAQQPEFMDSLISTARIGRSLGVHLILATQKPSGVVNDQIWSNTKFRVCLKVQDASDSKEMLKKPDAAELKQTGRFYLQVGYDEYYALGQSAWCGAKYFPSDRIVKQIDKSIDFIDNAGMKIKTIQESSGPKKQADGEQITAILKFIISVAREANVKSRRLWLDNIAQIVLISALINKYGVKFDKNAVSAVIGEYDAPELQTQGVLEYNYISGDNTVIYGLDGLEREMLLNTIIYSTSLNYSASDVNFYIVDYGSESLRRYESLPHVGGMVFQGEDEKFHNLLKMVKEELQNRKKLFVNYGGEYKNYNLNSKEKLPIMTIILNNYDSIYESNQFLFDELPELVRDSDRYGIIFMIAANTQSSISTKVSQNCPNIYAFHLKEISDYNSLFNIKLKNAPRDVLGRGICKVKDGLHEFQVASIVEDSNTLNDYIIEYIKKQKEINPTRAKRIPILPDIVRYEDVNEKAISLKNIPVGISKNGLNITYVDYTQSLGNIITSNRISNTRKFTLSLLHVLRYIPRFVQITFDSLNELNLDKKDYPNYYNSNLEASLDTITNYINKLKSENSDISGLILIYGFQKFMNSLSTKDKFTNLVNTLKSYEKISIIIVDDVNKIKSYNYEPWYSSLFNTNDGIWIGKGLSDQSLLRVSTIKREMLQDIKNDMGYVVSEGSATLCRLIDFISEEGSEIEDE
ncbi:MAG: type VII secretion protein EssC [Bacilli bacterium]|nr:type VII secretion protein EssC [Bacilli bacterium]